MRSMIAFAAACALSIATAQAATIADQSYTDGAGGRVLRQTIVVDAPREAVWEALTTDSGMARWAVPIVHVTPGNGGLIEFAVRSDGRIGDPDNVRNRIDVFLPNELLVMHNEFVPAGGPFDPQAFAAVRTLLSFADAGDGKTEVTQTVVGFGAGASYDQLYAHLREGNAEYLNALAASFHRRN